MKRGGFTAEEQERIANKFQRMSDVRTSRSSGLGFSSLDNSHDDPSVNTQSTEEKAAALKRNVKKIIEKSESNPRAVANQSGGSGETDQFARHNIMEAISDESVNSLFDAKVISDSPHNDAIFCAPNQATHQKDSSKLPKAADASSTRKPDNVVDSANMPLYKTLRVGDKVLAEYSDGMLYDAEVVAVIHGGYPSAKYDVKYKGYSEICCLSWKKLRSVASNQIQSNDNIKDSRENRNIGRDGVDEFGREVRLNTVPSVPACTHQSGKMSQSYPVATIEPKISLGSYTLTEPISDTAVKKDIGICDPAIVERKKGLWRHRS